MGQLNGCRYPQTFRMYLKSLNIVNAMVFLGGMIIYTLFISPHVGYSRNV